MQRSKRVNSESNRVDMLRLQFIRTQLQKAILENDHGFNLMNPSEKITYMDVSDPSDQFEMLKEGAMRLRIIITNRRLLLQAHNFAFVGFFGQRKQLIEPDTKKQINEIDQKLIEELPKFTDMYAYCTLESRCSEPCNLVVIAKEEVKQGWANSQNHRCAVYKLAPYFYEVVHIHNGVLKEGVLEPALTAPVLLRTKTYEFSNGGFTASTEEYEPDRPDCLMTRK